MDGQGVQSAQCLALRLKSDVMNVERNQSADSFFFVDDLERTIAGQSQPTRTVLVVFNCCA